MPIPPIRRWLCMTGLLAACGETPTRSATQPSVLFHNGPIVTMAGTGTAEALAIAADRVLVAGSTSAVLRLAGPATRLVDLEGRTVLPGIVDAHTHLFNDAEQYLGLDLAGAQALALENGITTLGDLFVTDEFRASMEAFAASGQLKIRTSLCLTHTDNCGGLQGGNWWTAHPPTRGLGERLRIGGIKIFADGGTCGRPAVSEEYSRGERPDSAGEM